MESVLAIRHAKAKIGPDFIDRLDTLVSDTSGKVQKADVVETIASVIPNFAHVETEKNLDQRMYRLQDGKMGGATRMDAAQTFQKLMQFLRGGESSWTLRAGLFLAGVLVIAILVTAVHMAAGLTLPAPWGDEAYFLWQARGFERWNDFIAPEIDPERPLLLLPYGYPLLMGIVFKIFGFSLETARAVSLVATLAGFGFLATPCAPARQRDQPHPDRRLPAERAFHRHGQQCPHGSGDVRHYLRCPPPCAAQAVLGRTRPAGRLCRDPPERHADGRAGLLLCHLRRQAVEELAGEVGHDRDRARHSCLGCTGALHLHPLGRLRA